MVWRHYAQFHWISARVKIRTGISGAEPNCCRALGKSTSKNKLQTAVGGGGGSEHPKKTPVSAHGGVILYIIANVAGLGCRLVKTRSSSNMGASRSENMPEHQAGSYRLVILPNDNPGYPHIWHEDAV